MNTLERHCRFLLRAYPAAYREVRGEEIIGTLLEATTPGRSWPRLRDIRGLAFSGLRARAMFNRQLTTRANLRIAVQAGVAAYLAYSVAGVVVPYVRAEVSNGAQFVQAGPVGLPLLACGPILVTVGLVWLAGSRMVVLAGALPSAAAVCVGESWHRYSLGAPVVALASLAAMVALSGNGAPPNRRWLALIGFFAVLPIVAEVEPPAGQYLFEVLLLTAGAVGIVWAVIDARPAIAMSVFLLGTWLPTAVGDLTQGLSPVYVWPYVVIMTLVAVPAVWLLRRQSAHASRPTPTS